MMVLLDSLKATDGDEQILQVKWQVQKDKYQQKITQANTQYQKEIVVKNILAVLIGLSVFGAIYALQQQNGKNIHLGGKSALSLLGFAHYIEMSNTSLSFFAQAGYKLPKWFKNNREWKNHKLICSSFLPPQLGTMDYDLGNFKIKISISVSSN